MITYIINLRLIDPTGEKRSLLLEGFRNPIEAYSILNETVKVFANAGFDIIWSQVSMIDPNPNGKTSN